MIKIFRIALKNTILLYLFVVIADAVFYTFTFALGGILQRDIFNKLQGLKTFLDFNITSLIILAAVIPLSISCIKQLNSYLVAAAQQNIGNNLKEYLYKIIYKIPLNKNINASSGEIITRFRDDVMDIVNFFTEIYNQMPKLTLSIAALIIMFKVSNFFAFVSMVPLITIVVLIGTVQKKLVRNKEAARKSTDKATEFLGDIFSSLDIIKLTHKTESFLAHYKKLCTNRAKHAIKDVFFQNLLLVVSSNLMYFALGVILFFANNAIQSKVFSVGDFVLYEYYFWFLSELPTVFSATYSKYKQMRVAKKRLNYFEALVPNLDAKLNTTVLNVREIANSIDNIEINYSAQKILVKKNELLVIGGKNASGKSFLLKNIFVNSQEYVKFHSLPGYINKSNTIIKPPQMCYLPQIPYLITDTIKNNICMSMDYDVLKMSKVLEIANLNHDIELGILSLDTHVGNSGDQLSGGQKKRLALARLLYREPEILLLDDITSGLDLITEQKVLNNLKNLSNTIIIIASNNPVLNNLANNAIVLVGT